MSKLLADTFEGFSAKFSINISNGFSISVAIISAVSRGAFITNRLSLSKSRFIYSSLLMCLLNLELATEPIIQAIIEEFHSVHGTTNKRSRERRGERPLPVNAAVRRPTGKMFQLYPGINAGQ